MGLDFNYVESVYKVECLFQKVQITHCNTVFICVRELLSVGSRRVKNSNRSPDIAFVRFLFKNQQKAASG